MARGPFQGTFNPNARPTIVTAPDALVMINGETDLMGCPSCKRKFDLSKYITSIQMNLSVDSVPGSATINLSIPRHAVDDFYFDGNPIITPMMEVELFAKGYYLVEGIPQYYPIFWGLVTEVTDGYSSGEHTFSINCADILKWWEICKMNVNPAYTAPQGQGGRSIFGNVFFGTNPYDMIYTLAQQSFGDIVIGTGSLTSVVQENGVQAKTFNAALADIMLYWEERFSRVRSNLLLYGVNGSTVRGDSLYEYYRKNKVTRGEPFASRAVRNANGGDKATQMGFDPTDPNITAFRTQFMNAGQISFWQGDYQTKLELANACKEAIGFEFYMDVTGDIVFKPPFYNLDVIANKPVSWIQDIDIIDWDFQESESEVITQIQMQGTFGGNVDYGMGEEITPFTSVTDYHLLRKYGWRTFPYNSEFMGDTQLMFYHGLDMMDRHNSKRHHGSITIPLRPELRLGFPIYIAPKDAIWYISGISHNIAFGGRATTTLTLTAKRTKFLAPRGIGTLKLTGPKVPADSSTKLDPKTISTSGKFDLSVGEAAQTPPLEVDPTKPNPYEPLILRHPKTGRMCGYPNVVMVYTRPFIGQQALDARARIAGQKKPGTTQQVKPNPALRALEEKTAQDLAVRGIDEDLVTATEKYNTNRYKYGLNSAGVYVYAYESTKAIDQFVLLTSRNITVTKDNQTIDSSQLLQGSSAMVRPVSDERGFEVIGHYRYGRGISLRDGSLVLTDDGKNTSADISAQVTLAGGLFETLTAQSQGLTTVSTAYPNPAVALSKLQPEDIQTAAVKTPSGSFEYVNTETNFVSTAPLGSPEREGSPVSVEASQLSHARTLAELTVQSDSVVDDKDCICLLGRSDLAFINVGYQIKVLNTSSTESDLFNDTSPPNTNGVTAFGDSTATGPVLIDPNNQDGMVDRVEKYLSTLYIALDGPHQAYEAKLRGEIGGSIGTDGGQDQQPIDLFAPPPDAASFDDFSPPFSSVNRAGLGDPIALAQQADSAKAGLSQKLQQFGADLRNASQIKTLQAQVATDQGTVNSLTNQLNQLTSQLGTAPPPTKGAIANQIQQVQAQLTKAQQQLNNDQSQLQILQNQSPNVV